MKKKQKGVLKIIITMIIICFILMISNICYKLYYKKNNPQNNVVDKMKNYNYALKERDHVIMKNTYKDLKEVLSHDNINMDDYAKDVSKLFVIDLFTLDNKENNMDVGGIDYVYESAKENFKLNVSNTLYKIIKTNYDGKRHQELPAVSDVKIENLTKEKFKINNEEEYDSYKIELNITYDKDLGYDKRAIVKSIIKEGKIYIVEYTTKE